MPAVTVGNGFGQFLQRVRFISVVAIAVGALDKKIVHRRGRDRIMHEQRARAAKIAGKKKARGLAVFRNAQFKQG